MFTIYNSESIFSIRYSCILVFYPISRYNRHTNSSLFIRTNLLVQTKAQYLESSHFHPGSDDYSTGVIFDSLRWITSLCREKTNSLMSVHVQVSPVASLGHPNKPSRGLGLRWWMELSLCVSVYVCVYIWHFCKMKTRSRSCVFCACFDWEDGRGSGWQIINRRTAESLGRRRNNYDRVSRLELCWAQVPELTMNTAVAAYFPRTCPNYTTILA